MTTISLFSSKNHIILLSFFFLKKKETC